VTQLHIGPEIAEKSDLEIIEWHNECLRDDAKLASTYKHMAVEAPLGTSRIEYVARSDQWVPRGSVLCFQDDESGRLTVMIDEQELRLKQFGKLLTTYGGWGMRIEFVPEDKVHRRQYSRSGNPRLKTVEFLPCAEVSERAEEGRLGLARRTTITEN
jgi:hypothetical protein